MLVLDAYAIEAYLANEPAADDVERLLLSGEQVLVSVVNLAETIDRLVRVRGVPIDEVAFDLAELSVHVSGADADLAWSAAQLRSIYYHRERCSVTVADCFAAALSLNRNARLATADPHLLDLVTAEGGDVEVLPDRHGRHHHPG